MKRNHILINSEKVKIPNWVKWIILFLFCSLITLTIGISGNILSSKIGIDSSIMMHITNYFEAFIILTLIYDLAPRFKLFFSIIASIRFIAIFVGTADRIVFPISIISALIGILAIFCYNIILYKRK